MACGQQVSLETTNLPFEKESYPPEAEYYEKGEHHGKYLSRKHDRHDS